MTKPFRSRRQPWQACVYLLTFYLVNLKSDEIPSANHPAAGQDVVFWRAAAGS